MNCDAKVRALLQAAEFLNAAGRVGSAQALLDAWGGRPLNLPTLRRLHALWRISGHGGQPPGTEMWKGFGNRHICEPKCLTVLDEISELNWSTDFSCTRLVRRTAAEQIKADDYDLVLLESAWRGHEDDWLYAFTSPGLSHPHAQALIAVLKQLRETCDTPVVMINKEDPLHYDKFLPVMKYADHIFTTDSEMVPRYREHTDALTVTPLPFAANLSLTNPVDRVREPQEDVCFAGSYYSEGHEERARQMNYMLDPILEAKGAIYDRMSVHDNPRYHFPERFRPFIRPSVSFREMNNLYRRFRVFLNVNTITTSPTMMSRRVYELLASGTPVVSAPSRALEEQFGDIVPMASDTRSACDAVNRLLTDDRHWWKTSQKGIREIALKHQYKHRAALIRSTVLGHDIREELPLVTIVMSTKRWVFMDRIIENISRQVYPRVEVIFALRESWPENKIQELQARLSIFPHIKTVKTLIFPEGITLGSKLNAAIGQANGYFVAKFDDDDWYFPNYLQDMILSFEFSGADLCGKWTFPVWLEGPDKLFLRNPGHEHKQNVPFVAGPTLVARKSWLLDLPFADRSQGEDTDLIKRTQAAGGVVYSADHFNFIQYRSKDMSHHTWVADTHMFEKTGNDIGRWANIQDWIV
ncbi:MAG: glycosyltransferase [Xanthobacter sp.]